MRIQAISDQEFQSKYHWTPPKIIDRSDTTPGQQMLPGMHQVSPIPKSGITDQHPLYNQRHNPSVWGSLVGHHNPFLDTDMPDQYDMSDGWDRQEGWDEGTDNHRLADKVTKHLQKVVSEGHPCVAVTGSILHRVLSEGRLKSQFETQTSNGALNIPSRAKAERANFGYRHPMDDEDNEGDYDSDDPQSEYDDQEKEPSDLKHPDHARPIYGYLAHDPIKNTTSRQYGEHTLVLKKPKVWHRTTTTMGDSLGEQDHMRASPVQHVSLDSANHHDAEDHWGGTGGAGTSPEDYEESGIDYDAACGKALQAKLAFHMHHSLDDTGDYTEAQYHGGLSTNDIHYAVLRGGDFGNGHRELKEHLNKVGVPWVHIDHCGGRPGGVLDQSHHEALLHRAVHYQVILVAALEGGGMAKIIATRGEGIYLLDLGDGKGQIANTRTGVLYPPKNLGAIISRGYWDDVDDVDAADVLHLVKPL